METANVIALFVFLSALTQTLVDVLKTRFGLGDLGSATLRGIIWPIVAAAVGIGLSFSFGASIVPLLPTESALAWPLDRLLSGVIIGAGGASLLYDLLDQK